MPPIKLSVLSERENSDYSLATFLTSDDALSSKLIMCLITFGKLSEALELYKKLSSEGVKLRVGAIEALAKAILAQNKLNEVVPLIEGLEEKDAKLEPQLAQDILTAALDDKVRRCLAISVLL